MKCLQYYYYIANKNEGIAGIVSFWTSISFGNGNSRTARPAKCTGHRSMKSHFVITLSHSMICGLAGALMRGCACDVLSHLWPGTFCAYFFHGFAVWDRSEKHFVFSLLCYAGQGPSVFWHIIYTVLGWSEIGRLLRDTICDSLLVTRGIDLHECYLGFHLAISPIEWVLWWL